MNFYKLKIKVFENINIVPFLIMGLVITFIILRSKKLEINYYHDNFQGVVDTFFIGDKGDPVIWINNSRYALGEYGYEIAKHLKTGDSIVKIPDSFCSFLYRKESPNNFSLVTKDCIRY